MMRKMTSKMIFATPKMTPKMTQKMTLKMTLKMTFSKEIPIERSFSGSF